MQDVEEIPSQVSFPCGGSCEGTIQYQRFKQGTTYTTSGYRVIVDGWSVYKCNTCDMEITSALFGQELLERIRIAEKEAREG